jgi:hypothetical protein
MGLACTWENIYVLLWGGGLKRPDYIKIILKWDISIVGYEIECGKVW